MIEIAQRAAEQFGGVRKLAAALGIKHTAFYSWTEIPDKRVRKISELTGIPLHELRPDLYDAPQEPNR
jgi:DNA-binding transcriptional regulator YdaS (Cro superfamily)